MKPTDELAVISQVGSPNTLGRNSGIVTEDSWQNFFFDLAQRSGMSFADVTHDFGIIVQLEQQTSVG